MSDVPHFLAVVVLAGGIGAILLGLLYWAGFLDVIPPWLSGMLGIAIGVIGLVGGEFILLRYF